MEDFKSSNSLFNALKLKPTEKSIGIHENGLADANFIITSFMQEAFSKESDKVCLVAVHNTVGHYQNVGRRLGYDFLGKVESGHAAIVEFLKAVANALESDNEHSNFFSSDKEAVVKELFLEINAKIEELLENQTDGRIYLIVDDITHLLDLGVDVRHVVTFLNCCVNLDINDRIIVVINCHISNMKDKIVASALSYATDLIIDVSPLKTGISSNVTGIIRIKRGEDEPNKEDLFRKNLYHYRAYDREIRVFPPGSSLFYMGK